MRIKNIALILIAALIVAAAASLACAAQSKKAAPLPKLKMLSTKTCAACVQMNKVLKKIDSNYAGKIATQHVYLEDHPEEARKYNVRYVPTLIFIDAKGNEFATEIGYRSLDEVLEIFREAGVKI